MSNMKIYNKKVSYNNTVSKTAFLPDENQNFTFETLNFPINYENAQSWQPKLIKD